MTDNTPKYQPIPIPLESPRDLDGKPVSELTMRPPTTSDVVVAQSKADNPIQKDVLLYANLTDTSENFIQSLAFYDFKQVEKAFDAFMCPVSKHVDRRALFLPKPLADTASEN
ncbi:phage tail assembly protein [Endozoicomonas gorgoniicola]|uniref:Phage tail assembly protein n=1 Tax=Endozoicomonas gorgoniicola TaxID=1234144 RepID=A0ABT3MW92_9GAMM|nr:phage tail assembly protein [Endozoicomonas gorgoniicola]MCW7553643.1 phage tail assembly protein [Endozoicomonas gorgoniicola]